MIFLLETNTVWKPWWSPLKMGTHQIVKSCSAFRGFVSFTLSQYPTPIHFPVSNEILAQDFGHLEVPKNTGPSK